MKIEVFFYAAGGAMAAHIVSSQLLRAMVGWGSPLAMELFAVPNAPAMRDVGFRLLSAKYFLPWTAAPSAMKQQTSATRWMFMLARVSVAAFPILMLSFFGAAAYVAAR